MAGRDDLLLTVRGYKYIFVQEARELFGENLNDSRLHLSTIVQDINYSDNSSIKVTTDKGEFIASKYVVSTMSLGVLQHQDVTWTPKLPDWKKEAIFTFSMATYQKIFMLFPTQFWGNEQVRAFLPCTEPATETSLYCTAIQMFAGDSLLGRISTRRACSPRIPAQTFSWSLPSTTSRARTSCTPMNRSRKKR